MRIAIIGGNLLGCSTAVYTRRAVDSNVADSAESEPLQPNDTITIFERSPQLGGNKFRTLTLSEPTPAGTAAAADITAAPAFTKLLSDAKISPNLEQPREWAVFDWNADSYTLFSVRSRMLDSIAASPLVYPLQILALISSLFFANLIFNFGRSAFLQVDGSDRHYANYPFILWAANTILLGFGVVPLRPFLRLYSRLLSNLSPRIISGITYGGHSISMLSMHFNQTKTHIETILSNDAATSCVTPGHLLSACGLAKFAKISFAEFLGPFNVQKKLQDDIIIPSLASTYADSSVSLGEVNALAGLLSLLSRSHIPVSYRSRARYLNGAETTTLCDRLADAAGSEVKTGVNVTKVIANGSRWVLSGIVGGEETELGVFDAVVLAAVVDPEKFSTDAVENLSSELVLSEAPKQQVKTSKYVNLVKGRLRADFVKMGSVDGVAAETIILNCANCSEIVRVEEDVWRVVTGERLEKGNSVTESLFESVDKVVTSNQTARYGCCPPIRNVHGSGVPSFVLGTRFLYAACTDRIANDVNIDVLSARNTASFFKDGVAHWK